MEWLMLLVPIIGGGVAKALFPRKMAWWEIGLPFVMCILSVMAGKAIAVRYASSDTEYFGGYLVQAAYYEEWDEEVPCSHTKYCERTKRDGSTETYACGTEHDYDVDEHPPYWEKVDSNGRSWYITQSQFKAFCKEWGNRIFVDMDRDYHSYDGDKYQANWDDKYTHLHPTVVEHSYENRVASSTSVLNYREVPKEEKEQRGLFEYPRSGFFTPSVLGYSHPGNADLDKTNALLGRSQQIRIWLLCFKNQPIQAGFSQEAYWKRGNKNELVVCTSLNDKNQIQWGHVFSWTDQENHKITVRQWLEDRKGKVLDVNEFNDFLKPEIEQNWKRKEFQEFEYIEVELSGWAYLFIFVNVVITTAGTLYYAIHNGIDADGSSGPARRRFGRSF